MREYILSLQHFAYVSADTGAGSVVNYAGGDTPSNAGTFNTLTGSPVSTGDLSVEMKTFYDKALIELADPKLVHDQFAVKKPIPRNGGKTIEFRKFSKLPKALTAITEGVTPKGNKLRATSITAQVDQYGDYIEQTDLLELTAIDNTIVEATKELANQAALTLDTVTRDVLNAELKVVYAKKDNGGGSYSATTSRADITSACPMTVDDVFLMATKLKSADAPKIGDSYVAIIHPHVALQLMREAGDTWLDIQKYASPDNILKGEIGKLGGVRFVESTEAKVFGPAEIAGGFSRLTVKTGTTDDDIVVKEAVPSATFTDGLKVWVNGVEKTLQSITYGADGSTLHFSASMTVTANQLICGQGAGKDGSAVYSTVFLGEGAYVVTELTGGGLQHIVKQLGYGNDPLNQRSSIGWKATKVAKIRIPEYIWRFESGSKNFSATEESN